MIAKQEHRGVKYTDSRTGSNRAHTFVSLLRAVSMIQESPSSGPLSASAQHSPSIPLSSSLKLTSGRGVDTSNTSWTTSTTTISNPTPHDSKPWVDKHLGSHVVLSELSTCAPPNVARAFSSSISPQMLRALSPMLAASVDRPQQHQQAQQLHLCRHYPKRIFLPPSALAAPAIRPEQRLFLSTATFFSPFSLFHLHFLESSQPTASAAHVERAVAGHGKRTKSNSFRHAYGKHD